MRAARQRLKPVRATAKKSRVTPVEASSHARRSHEVGQGDAAERVEGDGDGHDPVADLGPAGAGLEGDRDERGSEGRSDGDVEEQPDVVLAVGGCAGAGVAVVDDLALGRVRRARRRRSQPSPAIMAGGGQRGKPQLQSRRRSEVPRHPCARTGGRPRESRSYGGRRPSGLSQQPLLIAAFTWLLELGSGRAAIDPGRRSLRLEAMAAAQRRNRLEAPKKDTDGDREAPSRRPSGPVVRAASPGRSGRR